MGSAGIFRDVQGRIVAVPPPCGADLDAISAFRFQLNRRLSPEAVMERIRKHTALVAEARRVANG